MNPYLFMHLILLGLWGGLVLVEVILEFSLRQDAAQKHLMARLHYRIDLYAEIPILTGVLISGLLLLNIDSLSSPIYMAKVVMGSCPVVINALCVIPVVKRKRASDMDDSVRMERYTKQIFFAAATGIAVAMFVLGLGMSMLGIV